MRKIVLSVLLSVFCSCFYSSCNYGEEGIGDIYAVWKLDRFECNAHTFEPDTVFLAFQKYKGQYYYSFEPKWKRFIGEYTMTESVLTLHKSNTNFEDMYLDESMPTFRVTTLTSDKLILQRSDSIWSFSKFLEKY